MRVAMFKGHICPPWVCPDSSKPTPARAADPAAVGTEKETETKDQVDGEETDEDQERTSDQAHGNEFQRRRPGTRGVMAQPASHDQQQRQYDPARQERPPGNFLQPGCR